jgi:hypothetical protein
MQSLFKRDGTGNPVWLRTFPRCGTTHAKNAALLRSASQVSRLLC